MNSTMFVWPNRASVSMSQIVLIRDRWRPKAMPSLILALQLVCGEPSGGAREREEQGKAQRVSSSGSGDAKRIGSGKAASRASTGSACARALRLGRPSYRNTLKMTCAFSVFSQRSQSRRIFILVFLSFFAMLVTSSACGQATVAMKWS